MRRNKRKLTVGLLGVAALGGASVLALSATAFEGGVTLAPGTEESGGNYASSVDETASVLLNSGSAVLNNATISNFGNNGMAVALQGVSELSLNNAFITMGGDNSVAFLFDGGVQTLNVRGSLLGGTNNVALAQNSSSAILNLAASDKINGAISTTADSTLSVSMSEGNVFRGTINGNVSLSISSDSILYLTGDSFVTSLSDDLVDYSNIYLCGYTLSSANGAIEANDADCGALVGGLGAPARPIDDTPKPDPQPDPEPEPEPQPQPQPDPEPEPQPQPQPEPQPEPTPAPEPAPAPTYASGKGVYNPNTVDNVYQYFVIFGIALIGVGISAILVHKSVKSKEK